MVLARRARRRLRRRRRRRREGLLAGSCCAELVDPYGSRKSCASLTGQIRREGKLGTTQGMRTPAGKQTIKARAWAKT